MSTTGLNKMEDNEARRETKIKWDEETIREHDKLRGTRQKIEEPPTPYRYASEDGDEQSYSDIENESTKQQLSDEKNALHHQWEALNARLGYQAYLQTNASNAPTESSSSSSTVPPVLFHQGSSVPSSPIRSPSRPSPSATKARISPVRFHSQENASISPLNHFGEDSVSNSTANSVRIAAPANEGHRETNGVSATEEEAQFRKKRLAHYNEYKVVQALRKNREKDEDDESDDDDDDD